MIKKEVVLKLAKETGSTQKEGKKQLEGLLNVFTDSLVDGEKIEVRGFGTFYVAVQKAYIGRNPKTGESVSVPEKRVVRFKAYPSLNEKLN